MTVENGIERIVSEGPVLLDLDGSIARLRLNRPNASNGVSIDLLHTLYDVIMICHGDPRIRVVVLTGEGPNFCAGGDVKEFASKGTDLPDFLRKATAYLQISASALMRLDVPVVAAVQGYAAGGGGLGLVCAADVVIAARSSKFMAGATRVGMAPDAGVTVVLPRLVGFRRAMDIVLSNRVLGADEALDIGLITRVVPDEELETATLEYARTLAAGAPKALGATKRLLWNGMGLGVEACLPEEARVVSELSGTADSREGLAAVIEKRKPVFVGK
jgi:2-(1,2-epoxy-1,2-dihydrophenyl)acetyl-CoA isomerase